ncbi:hypothetical protein [Gordonia aquimaris]|jgi:hypothetical protein|uniref:Uncharacterized protein n=1 Tax=Gordonia aquimaris TaxID=2984863 RepID=A0A9X3D2U4_9ACTN|nr:hypothetical protein [Gordonia aquimaris]MCX2963670.1 hypothetical protein [Gordonia aquimaris]
MSIKLATAQVDRQPPHPGITALRDRPAGAFTGEYMPARCGADHLRAA